MDHSTPSTLVQLCIILESDGDLQLRVKDAESPQQIIDIASTMGCTISIQELRIWSKELSAPYFPWAGKPNEWRRNFFNQPASDQSSQER